MQLRYWWKSQRERNHEYSLDIGRRKILKVIIGKHKGLYEVDLLCRNPHWLSPLESSACRIHLLWGFRITERLHLSGITTGYLNSVMALLRSVCSCEWIYVERQMFLFIQTVFDRIMLAPEYKAPQNCHQTRLCTDHWPQYQSVHKMNSGAWSRGKHSPKIQKNRIASISAVMCLTKRPQLHVNPAHC